ncbi:hypothetical protein [Fusibacter ferrireducens]|uniref:Uncharacterized protein n=1 Tax=Fusibacter ferrireducens TaxID=2785058 RepID=A0ABS0A049_9FIRM|nr:hypothetical protein [Fusibacter ferrireducens]MBF4696082.1 hypothetical protein [Fusibacter ferrireducens]
MNQTVYDIKRFENDYDDFFTVGDLYEIDNAAFNQLCKSNKIGIQLLQSKYITEQFEEIHFQDFIGFDIFKTEVFKDSYGIIYKFDPSSVSITYEMDKADRKKDIIISLDFMICDGSIKIRDLREIFDKFPVLKKLYLENLAVSNGEKIMNYDRIDYNGLTEHELDGEFEISNINLKLLNKFNIENYKISK